MIQKSKSRKLDFKSFFRVGVSSEFILIRDDFPIASISPSAFSALCREMFEKNEEVFRGK